MGEQLYVALWKRHLKQIIGMLKAASAKPAFRMDASEFDEVGNRKSYSFNIQYVNGIAVNNLSGSAVARDLNTVLEESEQARQIFAKGNYKVRLGKDFSLHVTKL